MSEKIVRLNKEVNQVANQRAGTKQRRENSQRTAGGRSSKTDPGGPGTSAMSSDKAIAAATTAVISPPLRGTLPSRSPSLKEISFETAIIELSRRRESRVEEVLFEIYLEGVPTCGRHYRGAVGQ